MTREEMEKKALALVADANRESKGFEVGKVLDNIMDGTLVTVDFKTETGKKDHNLVHFGPDEEVRRYRYHSHVAAAVSMSREPRWFFRFIELAGVGGVLAFFLLVPFTILLCVLVLFPAANPTDPTVLEVVKVSFTSILGFFFEARARVRNPLSCLSKVWKWPQAAVRGCLLFRRCQERSRHSANGPRLTRSTLMRPRQNPILLVTKPVSAPSKVTI